MFKDRASKFITVYLEVALHNSQDTYFLQWDFCVSVCNGPLTAIFPWYAHRLFIKEFRFVGLTVRLL